MRRGQPPMSLLCGCWSRAQRGLPFYPTTRLQGHCSHVVTGASARAPQTGGFLPSPLCLDSWRKQAASRPILHSNNNRLPAYWQPCWGAGLEPGRPPHSTQSLAKHVFLFSEEGVACAHPEQTQELISMSKPD